MLRFFVWIVLHELVLAEGELFNVGPGALLRAATNVDAALMILHLLLGFKSLLALESRTFKFVLVMNGYIVLVDLLGRGKRRISDSARLHQPFYPTLVPEVRTAQLHLHILV